MDTAVFLKTLIVEHKVISLHILYFIGIIMAIHALFKARTPQGATAWCIALVTLPILTIPLYLIFGRNKFYGYVKKFRQKGFKSTYSREDFLKGINAYTTDNFPPDLAPLEKLAEMHFTDNNQTELLINAEKTYTRILHDIQQAEKYIIVEYYTVRSDATGKKLMEALLKKANEGIKVFFLFDDIGSSSLSAKFIKTIRLHPNIILKRFKTTKGRWNKFQLNFRNHRKIVIVDGKTALTGGINIGDEYLGKNRKTGYWRDTHCRVEGALVQQLQVAFLSDWFWATGEIPGILNWTPERKKKGTTALAVPTGPADELDSGILYFTNLINNAKERLWIATPYFVPDPTVIDALIMATLRGVEVKIIIPEKSDVIIPHLAAYSFFPILEKSGIALYRYNKGFMHQKVMLIDNDLASIGTANFDNRSMRLNFEVNLLVQDSDFAAEVEAMLKDDILTSSDNSFEYYKNKNIFLKFIIALMRLFAPVL